VYQNTKDKVKAIQELCHKYNLNLFEVCYMGDDLPDLDVLKIVGLASCPSDAVTPIKEVCSWVSDHEGGKGAVRELMDFLIQIK